MNKSNSKGLCTSGCLSPEAPPSLRAKGVTADDDCGEAKAVRAPRVKPLPTATRWRMVFEGLGRDPDAILEEFMEAQLAEVEKALAAADGEDEP